MGIGQITKSLQKAFRSRNDTPLAEDWLDHDATSLVIDKPFDRCQITVWGKLKTSQHRPQPFMVFRLGGC